MLMPPSVTEIRRPTTQKEEIQKDARTIQTVREQAQPGTLTAFSVLFQLLITYRVPMIVQDVPGRYYKAYVHIWAGPEDGGDGRYIWTPVERCT